HLPSGGEWISRSGRAIRLYWDNFPLAAALLPILGAASLWRRDRRAVLGLLLAFLTVTDFALCYGIDDIAPYYLTAWLMAALLVSEGLELRTTAAGRWRGASWLAVSLGPVMLVTAVSRNWERCDLSRATWVREFARQKLLNTDPGGVLISSGDD